MRCLTHLFWSKAFFQGKKHAENQFVRLTLVLLASCSFSFLSLLLQLYPYDVSFIAHLLVLYLILFYNQPSITREFNNKRLLTFGIDPAVRLRLLFFILCTNNPILFLCPIYVVITIIFNVFNFYRIVLLFSALAITLTFFVIRQLARKRERLLALLASSISIFLNFYKIDNAPLFLVFHFLILFLTVRSLSVLSLLDGQKVYTRKASLIEPYRDKLVIYRVAFKNTYRGGYKMLLFGLMNTILGLIASQFSAIDFTSIFLYMAMLELSSPN